MNQSDVFSFQFLKENINAVSWGPNNMLAIATENIVTIFQVQNHKMNIFRKISRHNSIITSLCWNFPSVEMTSPNAFDIFLAVGDKSGNCIIYDIYTSERRGGISPEIPSSIMDIKACYDDPSSFYILTSQPSLCFLTVGTSSGKKDIICTEMNNFKYLIVNLKLNWALELENKFHFISIDYYNYQHILLSSENFDYFAIKIDKYKNINSSSNSLRYPLIESGKDSEADIILNAEFFPFHPNIVVILTLHRMYLFDLYTNSLSLMIENNCQYHCKIKGIFYHSISDKFWLGSENGIISRYSITKDDLWSNSINNCISKNKILIIVSDMLNPKRICSVSENGCVIIVNELTKNNKTKLFVTSIYHTINNQILSWCTLNNKLAILSENSLITIFLDSKIMKFQIQDKKTDTISFYNDNCLIANGSKLHFIDLSNHKLDTIDKIIPKFNIQSDTLAFSSNSSTLELYKINGSSLTKELGETVQLFCPNIKIENKWAIYLASNRLVIIGDPTPKIYDIDKNIGTIVSMAFHGDNVFLASSKSTIQQFNINTGAKHNITYSSISIRSISIYKNFMIVCDMSNICSVLSLSTLSIVSKPIKGKEVQVIDDNFCLVQIAKSSLKLFKFPSLERFHIEIPEKNELMNQFQCCQSFNEFKSISFIIGDIIYIQFLQILENENNVIIPGLTSLTHEKYLANERCLCACNMNSTIDNSKNIKPGFNQYSSQFLEDYIEFLILTNQKERAIPIILQTPNKQNILLSYACLSPNTESIHQIMNMISIHGSEKIIALLLVISNDLESACNISLKFNDILTSMKYIKLICDDEMGSKFIKKTKSYFRSYLTMTYVKDFHATLSALTQLNEIAKAKACLLYIEENNIEVAPSSINPNFPPFSTLKNKINEEWVKILQKDLFV